MSTRIAELESHLRAWERRSRRRTMLLVLIPILVAAALAYAGHAQVARVEQALSEGLAGLSAEPELSPSLEQNLDRLPGLVAELKSLRPLPEQLIAARDARNRAEADLARLRDETSTLVGDRDGLATALGIAKGELARAQAERADIEQRQDELLRQVEASRAALAQREQALAASAQALEAERNARAQAEEQFAAEREARSAAEQARAALSGERERASQALDAERTARAEVERQLAAEREAKAAAEQARAEIEARLRQLTARQTTAAQQAARAAEELRSAGTDRARLAQELALAQTRASAAERAQADLQQQIRDLRAALAQAQAQRSGSWQENPPASSRSSGMMPASPRL